MLKYELKGYIQELVVSVLFSEMEKTKEEELFANWVISWHAGSESPPSRDAKFTLKSFGFYKTKASLES